MNYILLIERGKSPKLRTQRVTDKHAEEMLRAKGFEFTEELRYSDTVITVYMRVA
jgi:hypothetical protein